jgi:hypothetical protein
MSELLRALDDPTQIYLRNGGHYHFLQDLASTDAKAKGRLSTHHTRAAANMPGAVGIVPPTWFLDQFAIIAHAPRAIGDTIAKIPLPSPAAFYMGVQGAGVVVGDTAENVQPPDGGFTATTVVVNPVMKSGKVDVSRQLMDGGQPDIEQAVAADAQGALAEAVEAMCAAAITSSTGKAGTVPVPVTPDTLVDSLVKANAMVMHARKTPANVVFLAIDDWEALLLSKDDAHRPIVQAGYSGSVTRPDLGEALRWQHVVGQAAGLALIPSWALTPGKAYVCHAPSIVLAENELPGFRFEEQLGPETIRLAAAEYCGIVTQRYPGAIAEVDTS